MISLIFYEIPAIVALVLGLFYAWRDTNRTGEFVWGVAFMIVVALIPAINVIAAVALSMLIFGDWIKE